MLLGQTAVDSQSPESAAVLQKAEVEVPRGGKALPLLSPPKAQRADPLSVTPLSPHPAALRKFQVLFLLLGEITVNDYYGQPGFANSAPVGGVGGGGLGVQPVLGDSPQPAACLPESCEPMASR